MCKMLCVISGEKKKIHACTLICVEYFRKNTLETVIVDASRESWVTGWGEGRRLYHMSFECYAYACGLPHEQMDSRRRLGESVQML